MRIYLSSTLDDLKEYRAGVMDALRKDGHVVVDSYEATAEPTLAQCVADVAGCELYVGLFAWRYGWRPPGQQGAPLAITEIEYRAAVTAGKPRLVFMRPLAGWPAERLDIDDPDSHARIVALRKELGDGSAQTSNQFGDPNDLALKVSRAVRKHEDEAALKAEAPNREKVAGRRGNGLMEPSAPPHPHRLATGLLLIGVRGSDDAALGRLRDALPLAWRVTTRAWAPESDADLVPLDALAARSRCVAVLVSPAGLARLRESPSGGELLAWLDARLGGAFLLLAGVDEATLPPWPRRRAFPIGQWLATPGEALSGEMADLQRLLPEEEPDLLDEALVGLASTTIAMKIGEARALDAYPAMVQERLGQDAFAYFNEVAARLTQSPPGGGKPAHWTARYAERRNQWRPFGGSTADDLVRQALLRLNSQPFFTRQEHAALLGNRVRLRPYPFNPSLLQEGTPAASAYEAMRERGCLVLIDELSMLHPDIRPYASMFVSDARASVATLSPLDPSATALERMAGLAGPFNIGVLIDRFAAKLDPRCELAINSPARLRRWLRTAIPETLAATDSQAADPDRRDAFRKLAFGG